jgi:hypothetical protein
MSTLCQRVTKRHRCLKQRLEVLRGSNNIRLSQPEGRIQLIDYLPNGGGSMYVVGRESLAGQDNQVVHTECTHFTSPFN